VRRLLLSLLVVALVLPASAAARSAYCSPTGDVCFSAKRKKGDVALRFGTFALRGKVQACVTAPDRTRKCKTFTLKRGKRDIYAVRVLWSKHFPAKGKGKYRVRWRMPGGGNLGPRISFKR